MRIYNDSLSHPTACATSNMLKQQFRGTPLWNESDVPGSLRIPQFKQEEAWIVGLIRASTLLRISKQQQTGVSPRRHLKLKQRQYP